MLSLLAIVGLRKVEQNAVREILGEEGQEHGRLLDGVMELAGTPLHLLVEGYARRTVFTRPNEDDHAAKALSILETGLRLYGLDAIWIFEANGLLRLKVTAESARDLPPPIPAAEFSKLPALRVHFFMMHGAEIYEVRGRKLFESRGDKAQAPGWIFAADHLDAARLMPPRLPVEGRVSLLPPTAAGDPPSADYLVRIDRPLLGFDARPLQLLRVDYRPAEIDVARQAGSLARLLMMGFVLLSLVLLGFSVWHLVVKPAMLMQASLAAQNVHALGPLFAAGGDLARLAGFVRQSLETQQDLRQTLEERARLGRDLHDGVIQTIYSAGLGLARVRNHLAGDPAKADLLVLEVRATLDHAVKELRRQIDQLEPDASSQERLQISLQNLKVIAHLDGNITVDIQVEPQAESLLGYSHRVDLLHLASEAFSNGLRHGKASVLELRLTKTESANVRLVIYDNGIGFDPGETGNPFGLGLSNLRQRAGQLGGELGVDSAPGRGTRLSLEFKPK